MGVCGSYVKKQKLTIIDKYVPKQVELCDPTRNRLYKNHKLMSMTMMNLESCAYDEYEKYYNNQGQTITNIPDELLNQHKGSRIEAKESIVARDRTPHWAEIYNTQTS